MRTLNTTTLDNMERFIIDYQKRKGKSPSFREVMKALNMSSLNLVRTYILALENSGRIERTRLGNIDMLPKLRPSGVAITPIVGSIACGQPVDAVEQIEESVTLPRAIFGGGDLFILHTHGDSMIDIGIKHGDLVVIRKQNTAENGDIINTLTHYTYLGNGTFSGAIPKGGGVYIIFEKGEKYGCYDRIARIGKAEKSDV